ncbi:gamma-glutamyltransferase [Streptomyces sp. M19]
MLCGQGPAPAGASPEHYAGLGLDLVPGTGPLAAAVPGAFDAWMLLLRDHGTKRLADVLRYAIGYAADGHPPVERVGETVETVRELFTTEWTTSAEVYLPGGQAPVPGRLFTNRRSPPPGGGCWPRRRRRAADARPRSRPPGGSGARVHRRGAAAAAARPTMDTSGERHSSTLTGDDLAAFRATYEEPVRHDWNGWTVCKPGAWSQARVLAATRPAAR